MYPRKLQLHRKGHSNRVSDFHDFVCSSLPKAIFLCPPSPTKGSEAGGRGGGGGGGVGRRGEGDVLFLVSVGVGVKFLVRSVT